MEDENTRTSVSQGQLLAEGALGLLSSKKGKQFMVRSARDDGERGDVDNNNDLSRTRPRRLQVH